MGKIWPMGHSLSTCNFKKQSEWTRVVKKDLSIQTVIDLDGWGAGNKEVQKGRMSRDQ